MRTFRGSVMLIFLSAAALLHADATIRFKMDMKLAASLPPVAAQQMANAQKSQLPRETVVEIKGDKVYSNAGKNISVTDFTKQQITLVDPDHKLFATAYTKDFPGEIGAAMALPPMPPAAQKFLESIKPDYSVQKTGRIDVILGIQAVETELTVSLQMLIPADLPPELGALKPGDTITLMKMVMHIWTPLPAEVTRVPALTELAAHSWKTLSTDPTTALQQMLPNFPGISDTLATMTQEISKTAAAPALRTHVEMYIPVLAQLGALMPGRGQQALGSYDPNTPFMETNNEVVEISSAPVDASVFEIPSDYTATSLSDLLKASRPAPPVPSSIRPPNASIPPPPSPPATR
jgi:hypothetical protein